MSRLGRWTRAGACALLFALPMAVLAAGEPVAQPRASLLPARPMWTELTPAQRQILAELEPRWNTMPEVRRRTWLKLADRIPRMEPARMEPAERERAQARIREWASLTPEQRHVARENYRLAKTLPRDARAAGWEQYQQLTPEQRTTLRTTGSTSNTAARHAGAATGLAKQAARPMPGVTPRPPVPVEPPLAPTADPTGPAGSTAPAAESGDSPGEVRHE